jgi:1-acyl-sn-glycerol-3-phosphate acyltransferase
MRVGTEGSSAGRAGRLATIAATVGGNLFLVLGSIVFATLSLLVAGIPPRGHWVFPCARAWARGVLLASGVRLAVSREESVGDTPVVYMANHQSLFDIPALLASVPGQTRMLAKRSLFRIPIFGWAMKAGGFIAIDREDRSQARQSFTAAVEKLQSGMSTLVFPEGTRSATGKLAPFQRGGFLLALKAGLPIVPVGVEGSGSIRPKKGWAIRPRTLAVRYGRRVDPAAFGLRDKRDLVRTVRAEIARLARCGLEEGAPSPVADPAQP